MSATFTLACGSVKTLVDSSVIVAALVADDSGHVVASRWIADEQEAGTRLFISDHTLAEVYASITKGRYDATKLSEREARDVIVAFIGLFEGVIPTGPRDYLKAIDACVERGLRSGAVYDAIHLRAARRERIRRVVTFNGKHFAPQWDDHLVVLEA